MSSPKNRVSEILVVVGQNQELEAGIHYQPPIYPDLQFKMSREDEKIDEIENNTRFNLVKEIRKMEKKLKNQKEEMLKFISK